MSCFSALRSHEVRIQAKYSIHNRKTLPSNNKEQLYEHQPLCYNTQIPPTYSNVTTVLAYKNTLQVWNPVSWNNICENCLLYIRNKTKLQLRRNQVLWNLNVYHLPRFKLNSIQTETKIFNILPEFYISPVLQNMLVLCSVRKIKHFFKKQLLSNKVLISF
jgi:hypothetical protein